MTYEQFWRELYVIIDDVIDRKLEPFRYFADYGVVDSVSGGLANVRIGGSTDITQGIPYRSDMTVAAGDKVTILRLNFNANDRLIIDKK